MLKVMSKAPEARHVYRPRATQEAKPQRDGMLQGHSGIDFADGFSDKLTNLNGRGKMNMKCPLALPHRGLPIVSLAYLALCLVSAPAARAGSQTENALRDFD